MPSAVKQYVTQLRGCGESKDLIHARRIHASILASEHRHNRYLNNILIEMYGKCGSLEEAVNVFTSITRPNMFSWTLMISAYAQNGYINEARATFERMPDKDIVVWNVMVSAYSLRPGFLNDAEDVFHRMPRRDVVSWTAMVSAYAKNGHIEKGYRLFCRMPCRNIFSWNTMISACGSYGMLKEARDLFDQIPVRDTVSWNAILTAHAENGHPGEAKILFDRMTDPGVVSWNVLIVGYARNGMVRAAFWILSLMDLEGTEPDRLSFAGVLQECGDCRLGKLAHAEIAARGLESDVMLNSILIYMYGRCVNFNEARRVFSVSVNKNVVSWTAMMAACSHTGHERLAVDHFSFMDVEGVKADRVAVITVLEAVGKLGILSRCKAFHTVVADDFVMDSWLGNGMLNMYCECGSMSEARRVFVSLTYRDVVTWNVLMAGYAKHGQGKETIQVYRDMELQGDVKPDSVTLCILLLACSHKGLLEDGWYFLTSMEDHHGIPPRVEHLLCMVDLLGRVGQVDRAEEVMNTIKEDKAEVELESSGWLALLSACKLHEDVKRGARAMAALERKDSTGVLLVRHLLSQQMQLKP